jgi:hypothetical protein
MRSGPSASRVRSARSFRFAPFPRRCSGTFCSPALATQSPYPGWQNVVNSRNVMRHKEGVLMTIQKADKKDLQQILDLQYLAYQSEAYLLNNPNIPPLKETIEEVEEEFENGTFLKVIDEDDIIIGSVRAYSENGALYIGKLIVHLTYKVKALEQNFLKKSNECVHIKDMNYLQVQKAQEISNYMRNQVIIFFGRKMFLIT